MSDDRGDLVFVESRRPSIEAGQYRLTAEQEVGGVTPATHYANSVEFAVLGERCRLDPSRIDSVFPPENAQGAFGNVLPHVVLTAPTLPWQRTAGVADDSAAPLPWLAVLVFDQADPPPPVVSRTVGDLGAPEVGEAADAPCLTIDVPSALFARVAPAARDLRWLAHVRHAETVRKGGDEGMVEMAVVFGNRLPASGRKTTAHLVSLENLAGVLPDAAGRAPRGLDERPFIRLVTLRSWSFDSLPQKETFAHVLAEAGRDAGPMMLPAPTGPTRGRDGAERVRQAYALGYVPMEHRLRDGGVVASWYRGPLTPNDVGRAIGLPLPSADAALQYDPRTGMLDASLAAAWQIGRLLALQDRELASAVLMWKRRTRRDTFARAEESLLRPLRSKMLAGGESGAPPTVLPLARAVLQLQAPSGVAPLREPASRHGRPKLYTSPPAAEDIDVPPSIAEWVGKLRRLMGIPFPYLVPSEAMLPPNSIRFFHVDSDWVACAVDGALSLGRSCSADASHETAHTERLEQTSSDAPAGFLLRSRAVVGWPGLEIEADPRPGDPAPRLLRREALGPDVLLVLFDRPFVAVHLHEPPEGVHFGFDVSDDDPSAGLTRRIRRTTAIGGERAGSFTGASVPAHFRPASHVDGGPVVDVAALAGEMRRTLGTSPFTPAEFALQMIEGVGSFTIRLDPAP